MRFLFVVFCLLVNLLFISGCGGGDNRSPAADLVEGTWRGTLEGGGACAKVDQIWEAAFEIEVEGKTVLVTSNYNYDTMVGDLEDDGSFYASSYDGTQCLRCSGVSMRFALDRMDTALIDFSNLCLGGPGGSAAAWEGELSRSSQLNVPARF